jgi:hypothetical protein
MVGTFPGIDATGDHTNRKTKRAQARNTMVWPIAPISSHFVTIGRFNAIGIWGTTLMAYGQQQHRDMTNNDSVIWATTISAYDKQRQRDITNNGAGICGKAHKGIMRMILISSGTLVLLRTILIISSTPVLQYACTIENDSHSHEG